MFVLIIIGLYITSKKISKFIDININHLVSSFEKASKENKKIDTQNLTSKEFVSLANNLNITKMTHNNPKLKECKKITFNLEKDKDIVIEDLCFIKFTKKGKVDIYTKYDINIYERNNLI